MYAKVKAPLWPRIEFAVFAGVIVRESVLTPGIVLVQLNNFMTRQDKNAVESALLRIPDHEILNLFLHPDEWEGVYKDAGLSREQCAVLDEFLEDVTQILAPDPF